MYIVHFTYAYWILMHFSMINLFNEKERIQIHIVDPDYTYYKSVSLQHNKK